MDSARDTLAGGFPHSEIHGSKPVRGSPWLIAAYHVLHRLSAPRHPPNALLALDRSHDQTPPLGSGRTPRPLRRHAHGSGQKDQFFKPCPQCPAVRQNSPLGPPRSRARPDMVPLHDVKDHGPAHGRPEAVCSSRRPLVWWSQTGSNRRPHACKARALPTELWPHSREVVLREVVRSKPARSHDLTTSRSHTNTKRPTDGGPGKT